MDASAKTDASATIDASATMDASATADACMKRHMSKANLQVSEHQYEAAFRALLLTPPLIDMQTKLGPQLCSHVKQVTPGHLMAIHKAWMPLIERGCSDVILQSQKIKVALH